MKHFSMAAIASLLITACSSGTGAPTSGANPYEAAGQKVENPRSGGGAALGGGTATPIEGQPVDAGSNNPNNPTDAGTNTDAGTQSSELGPNCKKLYEVCCPAAMEAADQPDTQCKKAASDLKASGNAAAAESQCGSSIKQYEDADYC